MIRELTDLSVNMVKMEQTELVSKKAEENVNEKILDLLIPPLKKKAKSGTDEIQTAESLQAEEENEEANKKTRDRFREMLLKGELDERMIELDVSSNGAPMMQVLGPFNLEDLGINMQDLFGSASPKKSKRRKMTIAEARKNLMQEETQKLIDMDSVIKEAIARAEQTGIVFIDEIDKIAGGYSHSGPDVSREGVQRDLLPIVEGSTVMTKYGPVKTDHVLFMASGAFHTSKPSDLIPELQGRFPIRVELNSLTEDDFYKILTMPENALVKQYKALLATEGVKIDFTDDALKEIAKTASEVNEEVENIGARRLHTILMALMDDILFNIPDKMKEKSITIEKELVIEKMSKIVKNRDLSRYIL